MTKGRPRITDDMARITITIPADLLQRIDSHWHTNRLGSRSEAIRDLIERSLKEAPPKARK